MSSIWDFFISHWLALFWAFFLGVFVIIGIIKAVDEIRFRRDRRRYQRSIR